MSPRTEDELREILEAVEAPFKRGNIPSLGGPEHATIHIVVSIDPRESWINGIFHNSRYCMFSYNEYGKLELFSGGSRLKGFRKCTPKNTRDVWERINKYLEELKKVEEK